MSKRTKAQRLLWIEYLQAKADGNEIEAAKKLELLAEDLFRLLWIEYLQAKADGNEIEAAKKLELLTLELLTEDLFYD